MSRRLVSGMLLLASYASPAAADARQRQADTSPPKAPLVSVVGCARRTPQGAWTLANATDGVDTRALFLSAEEIQDAQKKALGSRQYVLVGTADFVTKEELLKSGQRPEFTRPEAANATGQLQDGRRLLVKGLLITAGNERRLNLVAVQQLAGACK